MEEVVQTLAEEGALAGERGHYRLEQAPTELHISPTVQGVLAARIDRLTAEEKELLQQLSVIGRQFPVSLVKQVVSQSEAELYRVLSSLQAKEFLYEQPAFPESEYLFRHALTQEVAYGTVLHEQCKALHERTGHAIEALYSEKLEDHYTELAHHYGQSGNTGKAVEYLHLAGQQAVHRSAHAEAIHLLTAALQCLKTLPATQARIEQELALQLLLGPALQAAKGWGAAEAKTTLARAQELSEQAGNTEQNFPALWGLVFLYVTQAEHEKAQDWGEHLLTLAEGTQDSLLLQGAHYSLTGAAFFLGDWVSGREHFEQGIQLYTPQQHSALIALYPEDPGVGCRAVGAQALWALGYPDQSVQVAEEMQTLARELAHPFSLTSAYLGATMLAQFRRDSQEVLEQAEALIAIATEYGFALRAGMGTLLRSWALTQQGQIQAGIREFREGLTAFLATQGEGAKSWWLGMLAEALGEGGQPEEGLAVAAEALEFGKQTGEGIYEVELHRLTGGLTLDIGVETEAETYFEKAIEVAQRQQAKSLELRAATSLARLWRKQGKTVEAHELLAPVYNWFTEGFDTADLKDARALLDELNLPDYEACRRS